MDDDYLFSKSGVYFCPKGDNWEDYDKYINSLPKNPAPEVFGMHENAEITNN